FCTSSSDVAALIVIPSAPAMTILTLSLHDALPISLFTGSLLWSNGATTSSITVTTVGTYSVTQTVNGCTSPSGSGVAAPSNLNVSVPHISVLNKYATSIFTAVSYTGSLLWSNGATT